MEVWDWSIKWCYRIARSEKYTDSKSQRVLMTSNVKSMLLLKLSVCNSAKSVFAKEPEACELLS